MGGRDAACLVQRQRGTRAMRLEFEMNSERPRLFMFKSGANDLLFGFASDHAGGKLPEKFGPWTSIGVIRGDQKPPHGLKRDAIENGIAEHGFQLWRRKPAEAKGA